MNRFPVSEYVQDELEARGWTIPMAASRLPGDLDVNTLWLEFLCCSELWNERDILFTEDDAERLSTMFKGTHKETWLNLHKAFLESSP